jgi:glycosyltransferase involved in cell wall biosynthesis
MSQDRPQFSVVIPTYNRAKILHRSLESIFSQTYPPAEIIVVNDGSADDTREVLASYGERIQAINQPNAGLSGARNTGIKAATSEWIVFLDDDDEHVPKRLALAAESIALHPEIDVHATNTALVNPDGSEIDLFSIRGRVAGEHMRLEHPLDWVLRGCFFSQAVVVRRKALEEVGFFRKTFYEDMDLFVRLAARGAWTVDARRSLRLIRLPGEDLNLSSVWRSKPVENYQSLVRIHREALEFPDLTAEERSVVKSSLATNLFELGRSLTAHGDRARARAAFQEAGRLYPKCHSRVKARLAASLGSPALQLMSLFQRQRGIFRSSIVKS